MEVMLKSKIVRETVKAKSYEVKTEKVTEGQDSRRLLDKKLTINPWSRTVAMTDRKSP